MAAISFTKFHAIGVAKKYELVDGVAMLNCIEN